MAALSVAAVENRHETMLPGGDERDESRAEMHPRNKCKANVSLQHVSSYLQRVASICSAWMTPHSNVSASNETFFVVAVVGRGRHAIHATSADDRMTSFLSSLLYGLQLNLRPGGLLLQIGDDDDDAGDHHDAANFLTESSHVRCDRKKRRKNFSAHNLISSGSITQLEGESLIAEAGCCCCCCGGGRGRLHESIVSARLTEKAGETMGIILQPIYAPAVHKRKGGLGKYK